MCVSKPQRVLSYEDGKAMVEFGGEKKQMKTPVPLKRGEYVICQAGFVVRKISEEKARDMLKDWKELNKWL
ncbi:HypC/HybG/HupF family hydrogenase formation chaperone [Candidatus Aenigmatarchaeota archaeon]